MRFGYFDDQAKEYVIERPDTPRSWANYLGSKEYGAIITNNGGGYSFHMSAAQGRLMRLRFDDVPTDQPGRYIYLRDKESGDYWSNAWQPVGKPLDQYKTTCRHGTAYTIINSQYSKDRNGNHLFRSARQTFRMLAAEGHEPRCRQTKAEPVHLRRIPELRARLQRFPQPAILARHRENGFRGRHH